MKFIAKQHRQSGWMMRRKNRIGFNDEVFDDVSEEGAFLAQQSYEISQSFLLAFVRTLKLLATMPLMGRLYSTPTKRLTDVRCFRVRRFTRLLIFYRPTEDGIQVLRLLHSSRNVEMALGETSQPRMNITERREKQELDQSLIDAMNEPATEMTEDDWREFRREIFLKKSEPDE